MSKKDRSFKSVAGTEFLLACGLFYFFLQFSVQIKQFAVFWITSLLSIPLGVWLGLVVISYLPSMIEEHVLNYLDNWHWFRGPRNINLIIYILIFLGFLLSILSHYARFSWDMEHALSKDLIHNRYRVIFLLTTIVLGTASTLKVVVAAFELIWTFRYKKQTGMNLYFTTKEIHSSNWSLVIMGVFLFIIAIVIFYRLIMI